MSDAVKTNIHGLTVNEQGAMTSAQIVARYLFPRDGDVAGDIAAKYGQPSDLVDLYLSTTDGHAMKWHHYFSVYERYFAPWRNRPLRFLEIGVFRGGSLRMWRNYFGPQATIFGIDIDPACAEFDGRHGQVRIGSQDDPEFLARVVDEMGGVDVILDDGSHHMDHIAASMKALFPRLSEGGLYMIEDLHTAYWADFGGARRAHPNFFASVAGMIDDMHHWYHGEAVENASMAAGVTGIHVHDSIVVLEKGRVHAPTFSVVGGVKAKNK